MNIFYKIFYKKIQLIINAYLIILLISSSCLATTAEQLTYYTENYPPSNYLQDGKLTGVSVDMLKAMWQEMNIAEQEIYIVPWARGYFNALNQPNSVLFTMARTEQRENLFKWVGPVYYAEHVLVVRPEFNENILKIEQAHKYLVAAIKNDISEITLLQSGFPDENIIRITNLKQAILMLQNKRLDMMIVSRASLKNLLVENNLTTDNVKIVYSVNKIGNYFAFNINTPDTLISQFQQAFDAIETQRKTILLNYDL